MATYNCSKCGKGHATLNDMSYCPCLRPTTSYGPAMSSTFNGMAQLLIVPSELRQQLREEVPMYLLGRDYTNGQLPAGAIKLPDGKNALNENQRCHHITMAFKATCGEMEDLRSQFNNEHHTMRFLPLEIRANCEICAIFGDVLVNHDRTLTERVVPGPHHITVAANEGIKPAESKKLATDYLTSLPWATATLEYPHLPQVFGLAYKVVSF